jgi:hypothetical protein
LLRRPKAVAQVAAPAANEKRRLIVRAAAVASVLLTIALAFGLRGRVPLQLASDWNSPARSFAIWIDPPQPMIYWMRFRSLGRQSVLRRQSLLMIDQVKSKAFADLELDVDGKSEIQISNGWEFRTTGSHPNDVELTVPNTGFIPAEP